MNILIIGKSGREHALAWKCKQSPLVKNIFVAPGNSGIQNIATCINISELDINALCNFAQKNAIDLTIVGPETSLEKGIADIFLKHNLKIFAPSKHSSQIEWSKDYCKKILFKYNIPTALYKTFTQANNAIEYIQTLPLPIVIKEDGLKAGKGVTIAQHKNEAINAINAAFETPNNKIVIEEFLQGFEFSLIALVHKNIVVPFEIAQDHKRVGNNDTGLNTGGMGAYSPVKKITPAIIQKTINTIMQPMADALCNEGAPFTGFLYGGFMLCDNGDIKTIEFNARFGDPEAEVLLPRLQTDLVKAIVDIMNEEKPTLQFDTQTYIAVVMASQNYPQSDTKGAIIKNINNVESLVFHMGTDIQHNQYITNGGRVLCIVDKADNLKNAAQKVYTQITKINCDKLFYRTDIGAKDIE